MEQIRSEHFGAAFDLQAKISSLKFWDNTLPSSFKSKHLGHILLSKLDGTKTQAISEALAKLKSTKPPEKPRGKNKDISGSDDDCDGESWIKIITFGILVDKCNIVTKKNVSGNKFFSSVLLFIVVRPYSK